MFQFCLYKYSNCNSYLYFDFSGVIGSGLCIFSRYQIVGSCFHQFMASGGVFDLLTGELLAAKGIGMCRIQLPNDCVISLYNSHVRMLCIIQVII